MDSVSVYLRDTLKRFSVPTLTWHKGVELLLQETDAMKKNLTHIFSVDFSILINWTSPFPILGVSDVLFHFYSISNRNSEDPDHSGIVCLCPKNGTLRLYVLYGLITNTNIMLSSPCSWSLLIILLSINLVAESGWCRVNRFLHVAHRCLVHMNRVITIIKEFGFYQVL